MDELYFDNKKYVTTKKAAALANYAKDYVGQLARSGKIDARLIGRNWYISEDALVQHAFGGKSKNKSSEANVPDQGGDEFSANQDASEGDHVGGSTGMLDSDIAQSEIDEPIQNNGLNIDVSAVENVPDEIHRGVVKPSVGGYEGSVTYWNDDTALMPTMTSHNHSGADVDSDVGSESIEDDAVDYSGPISLESTGGTTSTQHSIQHDDVSKITLTLRNRLRETPSQHAHERTMQRSGQANPKSNYQGDDTGLGVHTDIVWRVDTATVVKVAIFFICLVVLIALVFAMTGESSTTYIRK